MTILVKVDKDLWQKGLKLGFHPRHHVAKTSHGRYYYPTDSDYNNFLKFMEKKQKSEG